MDFHAKSITQVMDELHSSRNGLASSEAAARLAMHGPNVLPAAHEQVQRLSLFLHQFKSPLIIILLIAGGVSGLVGEYSDMSIILVTALLNACIGFIQEDKANQALARLQNMVEQKALVIRDGEKQFIPSERIVVGDMLVLSAGDKMAADARVIEAVQLDVNEAPLTGESVPVRKLSSEVPEAAGLADRTSMVYRGTTITGGRGTGVVTAVAGETEIGKIATLVQKTDEGLTPLQLQLAALSKQLGLIVVGICLFILSLGLFGNGHAYSFLELFQTSVAVAVAAIPEGLVISLTVILAIGMQQILKRRALVRKLLAAETLGSVSVICTDKTGTLTEGQMKVTRLLTAASDFSQEELSLLRQEDAKRHADAHLALRISVLCNDAVIKEGNGTGKDRFIGDTTEVALSELALNAGYHREGLEASMPRVGEIPFSSDSKYMLTVHDIDHKTVWYVKGAPEVILARAKHYADHGESKPLTDTLREQWGRAEADLAAAGLRVLAVAYKDEANGIKASAEPQDAAVQELVFVGLLGLSDPVRTEVKETIRIAQGAGIRIIMITGDHARTAIAVARELGIAETEREVMEGVALDHMDAKAFGQSVEHVNVYARVSPNHKIRIVEALRAKGEVVAMTGDGVNDAPALKGADIGVAVGSGTDVAKETADLVLLNDSFGTIVAAVEEGRRIYENIKKVILYLLVGSLAEVSLIVGCIILGLPLALLPAQILWINIIQETFPTMALAFDPGDKRNMQLPPRKKSASLFDRPMKIMTAVITIVTNTALFSMFRYVLGHDVSVELARTLVFTGLAVASLLYIYSVRSIRLHTWQMNPLNNWYLTGALAFGWLMLFCALYVPFLQTLLQTVPLGRNAWAMIAGFALLNILVIELLKSVVVRYNSRKFTPKTAVYAAE